MKMIKNELKFIFSNRIIRISLFVITFLPFLYSVFFLRSVWDPYGSTGHLPVAVVNEDKPVTYQGKKMHAGDDMVKQLKKNHKLGWRFVSKKEAEQGIKNQKYYTIVTLPKDFSANATTIMDKNPKKMEINYKTNDSMNYIARVVSDSGASKLDSQIKEAVTESYTKVMVDQVKEAGKGFKDAATGAQKLNDGSIALSDGLNVYTGGVAQVNDGVMTMKLGVAPLSNGVNQLASGSNTLNNGLQTLNSKTGVLASGANQLAGGANELNSGLETYTNGVDSLNNGLNKLNSNNKDLNDGAKSLNSGVTQLQAGSQQLDDGLKQIQGELNSVDYNHSLNEVQYMQNEINELAPLVANFDATSQALVKNSVITTSTDNSVNEMEAAMNKAGTPLTDAQKTSIKNGVVNKSYQDYGTEVGNKVTSGIKGQINSKFSANDVKRMQTDLNSTKALITKTKVLDGKFNNELVPGMDKLNDNLRKVQSGSNSLQTNLGQYTNYVSQSANGSAKLTANNGMLLSGSQKLANGTNQLNSQVPQLTSGISKLANGSNILYGGLSQLQSKIPTLTSGVDQLALGTSKLVDNSGALLDGSNQLKDGTGTLANALQTGAKKADGVKFTNRNINQFANPSKLKHSNYSSVPNYGYALAPYVLSLALYVGALVFNFAFPIRKVSTPGQSSTKWFLSKVTVGTIMAVAMGVIEPLLMMVAGLHPDHIGQMFAMTIVFSLTSMAVVMFLSMDFDNAGRFIAMILLMLQLGGSGGTFPMQMTSHFYNVVHPYIPMTYSILGLRQAITSGFGISRIWNSIGMLSIFIVISLILLWIGMYLLQKHGRAGFDQLDHNQDLQAVESKNDYKIDKPY